MLAGGGQLNSLHVGVHGAGLVQPGGAADVAVPVLDVTVSAAGGGNSGHVDDVVAGLAGLLAAGLADGGAIVKVDVIQSVTVVQTALLAGGALGTGGLTAGARFLDPFRQPLAAVVTNHSVLVPIVVGVVVGVQIRGVLVLAGRLADDGSGVQRELVLVGRAVGAGAGGLLVGAESVETAVGAGAGVAGQIDLVAGKDKLAVLKGPSPSVLAGFDAIRIGTLRGDVVAVGILDLNGVALDNEGHQEAGRISNNAVNDLGLTAQQPGAAGRNVVNVGGGVAGLNDQYVLAADQLVSTGDGGVAVGLFSAAGIADVVIAVVVVGRRDLLVVAVTADGALIADVTGGGTGGVDDVLDVGVVGDSGQFLAAIGAGGGLAIVRVLGVLVLATAVDLDQITVLHLSGTLVVADDTVNLDGVTGYGLIVIAHSVVAGTVAVVQAVHGDGVLTVGQVQVAVGGVVHLGDLTGDVVLTFGVVIGAHAYAQLDGFGNGQLAVRRGHIHLTGGVADVTGGVVNAAVHVVSVVGVRGTATVLALGGAVVGIDVLLDVGLALGAGVAAQQRSVIAVGGAGSADHIGDGVDHCAILTGNGSHGDGLLNVSVDDDLVVLTVIGSAGQGIVGTVDGQSRGVAFVFTGRNDNGSYLGRNGETEAAGLFAGAQFQTAVTLSIQCIDVQIGAVGDV